MQKHGEEMSRKREMSFTWGRREWITYTSEIQRDEKMEWTIFQQKKILQRNEETAYRKLISNTKILELEN